MSFQAISRRAAALLSTGCVLLSGLPLRAEQPHPATTTPIGHVVVIFQENVSFDHYFGTYPIAANGAGDPRFDARPGTPSVNGLGPLLLSNPNTTAPFRLGRNQVAQCDQDHNYTDEQKGYDAGLLDKFVQFLGNGGTDSTLTCKASDVMSYFDGNTVTALWNYAQRYAMSDNSFNTTFGPSTPGAVNLVSGQTAGVGATTGNVSGDVVSGTVISDAQPGFDNCSTRETVTMTGKNVGDLLNAKGITWGWFQGGFRDCHASHTGSDGLAKGDYIPHHEPFQYYASTSNPTHAAPTSAATIGHAGDAGNHQYDIADFWTAVAAGNMPAVSFLKAPGYQDGHAGYSNPLMEQTFLVETINKLQQTPEWKDMAIVIAYDDSDGWYDHVMPPIVSQSMTAKDALNGPGLCGSTNTQGIPGRCGYGPRLPLLVISPFARQNFVDHTVTDQSSILRFIEDNWQLGRIDKTSFDNIAGTLNNLFDFQHKHQGPLVLDPSTGLVVEDDGQE